VKRLINTTPLSYFNILKIKFNFILKKFIKPTLAMAWYFTESSNMSNLISNLQKEGIIRTESVVAGMKAVDRANYCLKGEISPYMDTPQYSGHDATISAPHMHGYALECLEPAIMVILSNIIPILSFSIYSD
jgi:hypothetical protein